MTFLVPLSASLSAPLSTLVTLLVDESPKPEDVKAGWTAFALFLLLGLAVVVLGFSLAKQLRKAQAAKEAGVYGDAPTDAPTEGPVDGPTGDSGGDTSGDTGGQSERPGPRDQHSS